jgi:hypothetical protein
LSIEGQKVSFGDETGIQKGNNSVTTDAVAMDLETGIYTLTMVKMENGYAENVLQIISIPKTMTTSDDEIYKFKAVLSGKEPRKGKVENYLPNIKLNCQLDVSL